MDYSRHATSTDGSATKFDLFVMPPEETDQIQATPMNRSIGLGSGSSMASRFSAGSYQDQSNAASPLSSVDSPSDGDLMRRGSQYETLQYLSPESVVPSRESSAGLPLFNIETHGDPNIQWYMYYDFQVTKNDAYFELQPGYLPTEKYPERVKSETVIVKGAKRYPCRVPACKAKPFTRHYDLERHFVTLHQADKVQAEKVQVNCDYAKCPHKEAFRKDHCREHYREYHAEDLIKRGQPKHSRPPHGQKRPGSIEEFLAARIENLPLSWWRCTKCVQRVKVNDDGYICPGCKAPCEPERVQWRESARNSNNYAEDGDLNGCGQCQNAWLPDEEDPQLWRSCPRCRPGITETIRF